MITHGTQGNNRLAAPDDFCLLCEPIGAWQTPLYPEEYACIEGAVAKRRREFTAGRALARAALIRLGLPPQAIPQQGRAPAWPAAVIGSITHGDTHAAVAVGRRSQVTAVGIDLERVGRVHRGLWRHVFTQREEATLQSLDEAACAVQATVLFGAKEAFYKLQYPLTGRRVGFEDVTVTISAQGRFTLACSLELPGVPHMLEGSFASPAAGLILCLLRLPPDPHAPFTGDPP